ncbi:unnamed protein product [Ilex paraguariensis]|uniref:Glycine-rich protein n=1 Tax=Ilex paraguariensis TaxID=185542 RepID=A0ABC8SZ52_9AQUA
MYFFLEVSTERGRENRGSGRSGRGSGGTGSNRGGGGGRGGNYPRYQHHQRGQHQSGGGGRGLGRGWFPTQTGDQQRGNRLGQRRQGGGAYRAHQHGGQGVRPTRVESSEGCVVGGGGGVRTGRPCGPTFVPGQSQPRSCYSKYPIIRNFRAESSINSSGCATRNKFVSGESIGDEIYIVTKS